MNTVNLVRLKILKRGIDYLHPAAKRSYVLGRIKKRLVRINFRGWSFVGLQPCCQNKFAVARFILLSLLPSSPFFSGGGGGKSSEHCSGIWPCQAPCRVIVTKKHQHQQLFSFLSRQALAVRCDFAIDPPFLQFRLIAPVSVLYRTAPNRQPM